MLTAKRWTNCKATSPASSRRRVHPRASVMTQKCIEEFRPRKRAQGALPITVRGFCLLLILIATTGALVWAQGGRGRGATTATNGFYRFNYGAEEMQPINYPAEPIATKHQITLHGQTIEYTARVGFMPIRHATTGVAEGHLFSIYYARDGRTDK